MGGGYYHCLRNTANYNQRTQRTQRAQRAQRDLNNKPSTTRPKPHAPNNTPPTTSPKLNAPDNVSPLPQFDAIDGIKASHQSVPTNEEVAEAGGAPKDTGSAIAISASASPNSSDLSGKEGALPMEVEEAKDEEKQKALVKMGMMTALAIGLHNFPEAS